MIIKRELPKFFTQRLIGFYIILLALLILSHIKVLTDITDASFKEMFQNNLDDFLQVISNSDISISKTGGGIIGACISWLFLYLFDLRGTDIVAKVFIVFGVIMFLDLNVSNIISSINRFFYNIKVKVDNKKLSKPKKEKKVKDDKVIISSYENIKEAKEEEPVYQSEVIKSRPQSNGNYRLPPINLLDPIKKRGRINSPEFINNNKIALEKVLNDFQIIGRVVEIHEGPAVTQYEIEIKAATKLSRITGINKEIALALAAKDVRIEAPIPGKSTVGIEIPNEQIATVPIREVFSTIPKNMQNANILVALGKDLKGRTICADLYNMPHLLVAGATGSGKSVCINSFIASILMFKRPDEVKLVLIDPKKVELSNYNGVPHLLTPVVTNPKKANVALQKIVQEMDERYELFEEKGVKNITAYNEMISRLNKKTDENEPLLPFIVVIIDELADLMLVAAKEVEDSIMRITQMARAAGIHLIVATQRPSTDIITGIVKANIPSRIAFTVASYIDSRTILDQTGAEKLLGKGDMLYLPMGQNHSLRVQGTFISDKEIGRLIDYVSKEQKAVYDESLLKIEETPASNLGSLDNENDELYDEVAKFAIQQGKISASLIQRRFRVGYNRAARILDTLEENGIVGPASGSKPREVLYQIGEEKK